MLWHILTGRLPPFLKEVNETFPGLVQRQATFSVNVVAMVSNLNSFPGHTVHVSGLSCSRVGRHAPCWSHALPLLTYPVVWSCLTINLTTVKNESVGSCRTKWSQLAPGRPQNNRGLILYCFKHTWHLTVNNYTFLLTQRILTPLEPLSLTYQYSIHF